MSSIFAVYVGWLYTGELELCHTSTTEVFASNDGKMLRDAYHELVKAYALGNFLNDHRVCNTLTDITVRIRKDISADIIKAFWEQLPHMLGMHRLFVDLVATRLYATRFEERADQEHPDFVLEIDKTCIRERHMALRDRLPENRDRC